MRLINADELMEHVWRDRLDSRELIVEMIEKAPTVKEIPTNIPIDVFEQLLSMHVKTGHWIDDEFGSKCSCCGIHTHLDKFDRPMKFKYCSMCGAKMVEPHESEG